MGEENHSRGAGRGLRNDRGPGRGVGEGRMQLTENMCVYY